MDTAVLRRRGSVHSPEIRLERLPPSRAHACAADGSASVTFSVQALMLVLHL